MQRNLKYESSAKKKMMYQPIASIFSQEVQCRLFWPYDDSVSPEDRLGTVAKVESACDAL